MISAHMMSRILSEPPHFAVGVLRQLLADSDTQGAAQVAEVLGDLISIYASERVCVWCGFTWKAKR